MTVADHTFSPLHAAWMSGAIRLGWTSTRPSAEGEGGRHGMERVEFVLAIEPTGRGHAVVEAWIEGAGRLRSAFARQLLPCTMSFAGGMIHVDIWRESEIHGRGETLVSVSVLPDENAARPAYARTTLLTEAGFVAGTYDPPRVQRVALPRNAATA